LDYFAQVIELLQVIMNVIDKNNNDQSERLHHIQTTARTREPLNELVPLVIVVNVIKADL
jgi:hypothetical protein